MKRFRLLVYCWKWACDGRKVIVKKQKYCSTANRVLCMQRKNSRTGAMISFKLMRPGWIPATPLRKAGKGKRLLV